jgi:hypothetical protein
MYMSTAEKYAELKHVRASEVSLCFLQFSTSTTRNAMHLSKALTSHTA